MIKQIEEVLAELKRQYPINVAAETKGLTVKLDDYNESFTVAEEGKECVIFSDKWHEHFSGTEDVKGFLEALFSGRAQIIVKFRGKTPVAHKVQMEKDGQMHVVSRTGSLISPFWRQKSYMVIKYK